MKLYLLLTLALVAVRMSSARIFQLGQNSGGNFRGPADDPDPLHCADCMPWNPKLTQLHGARWLCMRSIPPMQCPIRSYRYCKTYCEGAARAAPIIHEEDNEI